MCYLMFWTIGLNSARIENSSKLFGEEILALLKSSAKFDLRYIIPFVNIFHRSSLFGYSISLFDCIEVIFLNVSQELFQ